MLLPVPSRTCPWRVRTAGGVSRWSGRGSLPDALDALATGGALAAVHAGLDVVDVAVGHLDLGDLADLVACHAAGGLPLRRGRALVDARGLAQQVRRRGGLEDEGE